MTMTTQMDQSGAIHLSETGFHAGRRFCFSKEGESVHAAYAPLQNPAFRLKCCKKCMKVWANEAYEEGDEMPEYIKTLRESN